MCLTLKQSLMSLCFLQTVCKSFKEGLTAVVNTCGGDSWLFESQLVRSKVHENRIRFKP